MQKNVLICKNGGLKVIQSLELRYLHKMWISTLALRGTVSKTSYL